MAARNLLWLMRSFDGFVATGNVSFHCWQWIESSLRDPSQSRIPYQPCSRTEGPGETVEYTKENASTKSIQGAESTCESQDASCQRYYPHHPHIRNILCELQLPTGLFVYTFYSNIRGIGVPGRLDIFTIWYRLMCGSLMLRYVCRLVIPISALITLLSSHPTRRYHKSRLSHDSTRSRNHNKCCRG